MTNKLFENDNKLKEKYNVLSGTDEAGRGPLAGPLVVASVILNDDFYHEFLDDSKKMTEKKRDLLYDLILENCVEYSVKIIEPVEIDRLNILQATLKGMGDTILALSHKPELALIDGNKTPLLSHYNLKAVVKGDGNHACIAAASVLAKVTRDRIMIELDKIYPQYGFLKHKGYPTEEHMNAIRIHGITPVHRKSYKPVMQMTLKDLFINE